MRVVGLACDSAQAGSVRAVVVFCVNGAGWLAGWMCVYMCVWQPTLVLGRQAWPVLAGCVAACFLGIGSSAAVQWCGPHTVSTFLPVPPLCCAVLSATSLAPCSGTCRPACLCSQFVCPLPMQTPSSHELKELDRERNRQAREEAERRKGKKAAEKQRKRERQDQLARAAAAAATSAAEAAASAQAAAASAARLATAHEAEAGTSDSASSDGGAAAPAAEPAASAPEQRKRSGGKQSAPLPVVKAMAPKPAARRPAGTKQSALMRQAKRVGKEYSLQLLVGLGAVALLAVVSLVWTAMSVAPQ